MEGAPRTCPSAAARSRTLVRLVLGADRASRSRVRLADIEREPQQDAQVLATDRTPTTEIFMLAQAEVMCFAATKNAAASKQFYQNTLGLRLIEDSPFALVFDAHGTML